MHLSAFIRFRKDKNILWYAKEEKKNHEPLCFALLLRMYSSYVTLFNIYAAKRPNLLSLISDDKKKQRKAILNKKCLE